MDLRQFDHFSSMLTWMIPIFLPFLCSGMDSPKIHLESRVFVAITGEDLLITGSLDKPANQTQDVLTCFNPSHQKIYTCDIPATDGTSETEQLQLELKNLRTSGEYYCKYKSAKAHWFIRVRAEGYKLEEIFDYTEFIVVAFFTAALLVFSVVGSVYVFRGHLKVTKCGNTGNKKVLDEEQKKQNETGGDNVDVTPQTSSFYASLEPRPRSIYDVLDRSAANKQPNQKKAKPKKKDAKKAVKPNTEQLDEGVFECVYENF